MTKNGVKLSTIRDIHTLQVCSTEYESECETVQHPHDVEVSKFYQEEVF